MSTTYLDMLVERRQNAWHEQKAVLDLAVTENRDVTAEEQQTIERTDAAMDKYDAEIRRAKARMDAAPKLDEFRAEMAPRVEAARLERREATDAEILRQLLNGDRNVAEFHAPRDQGPAYERAARKEMERRALQSAGGSAVETSFYDALMIYERAEIPMMGIGTLIEGASGAPIVFPRLTADPSTSGTVTAEAGGILEADPTISSVTLGAFKYAAATVWSWELDQDNVIGLEDILARALARQLRITNIGGALTTGAGSTAPYGIITRAGNGGTALGTAGNTSLDTFVGPADLIDLKYSLAAPYRQVGSFIASTDGLKKARKFRDTSKQFLFQASLAAGLPDTFDGSPIYENPAMAAVASASKSFAFGDMSRYFIKRVTPVRIQMSDDYKFSTDQRAIKVVERIDADLIDTAAVNYLVSASV